MFIRRLKKDKDVESFDKPINGEGAEKKLKVEDTLKSDIDIETSYEDKEMNALIRKIVYNLPGREREIIMLYFGFYDGKVYKQREIAEKLNLSRSYVSRLINIILNDIREELEELGIVDPDLKIEKREEH